MKSITVTTNRSINYGAVLQSYALQQIQIKLGINNKILDMGPCEKFYKDVSFNFSKTNIIKFISNLFYFVHRKESHRLIERFNEFVSSRLNLTKIYKDIDSIRNDIPTADFYINGSDQVFGLRGPIDNIRMMEFLDSSARKFSYAASLGEYDWSEEEKEVFKRMIDSYMRVSVREQYAKDYLSSFTNVDYLVNIDPVFLLSVDEWNNIASDSIEIEGPYILCYHLIGNPNFQEAIDRVKAKTGYKVICLSALPMKRIKADQYIFDAGPAEFISLYKNASVILTTSFHGTAFSIIYEKPFYSLIKNYKAARIIDMLNMFNLSDRIYSSNNDIDLDLDFSVVKEVIASESTKSIEYLKSIKTLCKGI